jgi:hypothetical protein
LTLLIAAGITGSASGATTDVQLNRSGVVVQVPTGWQLTHGRINNVVDPVTVFTISTFHIQKIPGSASGYCSVALQKAWRASGAYVQLTEERDGASRARMLKRVQRRPARFVLSAKGAGGLCTPADSGSLSFQEKGRAFSVYYGFGPKAPTATRAGAAAMLDAMKITPRT